MSERAEEMNLTGGALATIFTVLLSVAGGLVGGSAEAVRAYFHGMTQAEATVFVGVTIGLVAQAGVWARWWIERRKKA